MTEDRLRLGHDPSRHPAHAGLRTQALRDDPRETCRASHDAQVMSDWMLDRSRRKGPRPGSESLPDPERAARQPLAASANRSEHRSPFWREASVPRR